MKCDKCKKDFSKEKWVSGQIYSGLDEHHNPPKFMMKDWEGKIYYLCRKHHRELHDMIIKILNEVAETLKFIKSEYWVWIKMSEIKQKDARKTVFIFTERWINNDRATEIYFRKVRRMEEQEDKEDEDDTETT